jgi:hypothetical protein
MANETDKVLEISLSAPTMANTLAEDIPPDMLASAKNTRYSLFRGTATKAPSVGSQVFVPSYPNPPGAIITHGLSDTTMTLYNPGKGGPYRSTDGAGAFPTGIDGYPIQSAYYPVEISDSGSIPGSFVTCPPACAFDADGNRWFASVRRAPTEYNITSTTTAVFVTVISPTGEILVSPTVAVVLGAPDAAVPRYSSWVGLTSHPGNGIRLWYLDGTAVKSSTLSVTGSALAVSDTWTPFSSVTSVGVAPTTAGGCLLDVSNAGDSTYAWVLAVYPSSAPTVSRVNVVTRTIAATSAILVSIGTNFYKGSLSHIKLDGTDYVGVVISRPSGSGGIITRLLNGTTLATIWTQANSTAGHNSECTFRFHRLGGVTHCISAFVSFGNASTYTGTEMRLWAWRFADGVLAGSWTEPNVRLASRGLDHKPNGDDTEVYPILPLTSAYSLNSSDDYTSPNYVEEPSVDVVRIIRRGVPVAVGPYTVYKWTGHVVARYGVDRVRMGTAQGTGLICPNSNNLAVSPDGLTVLATYTEENFKVSTASPAGYLARYVTLDYGPNKYVRPVHDAAGASFVSQSVPACYDGNNITEWSPFHRPKLVYEAGGYVMAPVNLTGDFWVSAVLSWKDATGEIHRSAPSTPVRLTPSASSSKLTLFLPKSYRDGVTAESYIVQIYATLSGSGQSSVFYVQNWTTVLVSESVSETIAAYPSFAFTVPALPTSNGATLYTTGGPYQPLPAEPLPPVWDACVIKSRTWAIDGERRYRAIYSKIKEPGIAYEFNSVLEVVVPATHGKLVSVAEWQGTTLLLAERGIWALYGEGPDNVGNGAFAPPTIVAEIGCTNKASVVRTPAGVFFESSTGYLAKFDGQVAIFDTVGSNIGSVYAAHFPLQQEVLFLSGTNPGNNWHYNYKYDRWSTWDVDPGSVLENVTLATQTPISKKLTLSRESGYYSYTFDPADYATRTDVRMLWETGWVKPQGAQGDINLGRILLHAKQGSAHGVGFTIYYDYQLDPSTWDQRTWTSAEIDALVDGSFNYLVGFDIPKKPCRAFKVTVFEIAPSPNVGGLGMVPVKLTVTWRDTGQVRNMLPPGSLK